MEDEYDKTRRNRRQLHLPAAENPKYDEIMALKKTRALPRETLRHDREYVRSFISLVDFLGAVLGPRTEVVLHDVSDADQSVIAIANGDVSGRKPGSPATDLMLTIMRDGIANDTNYIVGYEGRTTTGNGSLFSSTYFIRHEGRIVGMLCINTDRTPILSFRHAVDRLMEAYFPEGEPPASVNVKEENLITSVEDIPDEVIAQASGESGIPVTRFSTEQRLAVIRTLNERGFFNFKGAISNVAKRLGISESTTYRYLRMVMNN